MMLPGHMLFSLPAEQNQALASTPAAYLVRLLFLQPDHVTNSGGAYMLAKRANLLSVQAGGWWLFWPIKTAGAFRLLLVSLVVSFV